MKIDLLFATTHLNPACIYFEIVKFVFDQAYRRSYVVDPYVVVVVFLFIVSQERERESLCWGV